MSNAEQIESIVNQAIVALESHPDNPGDVRVRFNWKDKEVAWWSLEDDEKKVVWSFESVLAKKDDPRIMVEDFLSSD